MPVFNSKRYKMPLLQIRLKSLCTNSSTKVLHVFYFNQSQDTHFNLGLKPYTKSRSKFLYKTVQFYRGNARLQFNQRYCMPLQFNRGTARLYLCIKSGQYTWYFNSTRYCMPSQFNSGRNPCKKNSSTLHLHKISWVKGVQKHPV